MRVNDWPERLAVRIQDARHQPFQWGVQDCALWACSIIHALTDSDPAADWRRTYDSAEGARKVLAARGFDSLYELASSIAKERGFPVIPFLLAQRGDITICRTTLQDWPDTLAVCMEGRILAAGRRGLVTLAPATVLTTWRIA